MWKRDLLRAGVCVGALITQPSGPRARWASQPCNSEVIFKALSNQEEAGPPDRLPGLWSWCWSSVVLEVLAELASPLKESQGGSGASEVQGSTSHLTNMDKFPFLTTRVAIQGHASCTSSLVLLGRTCEMWCGLTESQWSALGDWVWVIPASLMSSYNLQQDTDAFLVSTWRSLHHVISNAEALKLGEIKQTKWSNGGGFQTWTVFLTFYYVSFVMMPFSYLTSSFQKKPMKCTWVGGRWGEIWKKIDYYLA